MGKGEEAATWSRRGILNEKLMTWKGVNISRKTEQATITVPSGIPSRPM